MNATDQTIEITCPECSHIVAGQEGIYIHIRNFHPFYTQDEAQEYAQKWTEAAHADHEIADEHYWESVKGDRS